jgi:hypothetical protein
MRYLWTKRNLGEKIKWVNVQEDADPEQLEANLLQKIIRRVLSCVVQSQYDLLGLLRAKIIK